MLSTSHKFCHSAIQLLECQMVLALWRFETLGNLVSAHHWHVRTTDLWCITGARCVSGATIATESTHRAPVILIQMGGVRVTASQVTPLTQSPFVSNLQVCGICCIALSGATNALVAPLTHWAPVTHHRSVVLTCHWCAETKFPAGINLVHTVAPDWVIEALDLNIVPALTAMPFCGEYSCELYVCVSGLVCVSVCICFFELGVYVCVSVFVTWCLFCLIIYRCARFVCIYECFMYLCSLGVTMCGRSIEMCAEANFTHLLPFKLYSTPQKSILLWWRFFSSNFHIYI